MAVRAAFISAFKQSLISLLFDLNGIIAGAIVAGNVGLLRTAPWVIMLYPAILSTRGTIGGIFSGHFSTALHLGNMKPCFRGNTDDFYDLLSSAFTLNFVSSISLWIVALPILHLADIESLPMLMLLLVTTGLAFLIIAPFSTLIISIGYKRGLDPDILSYPVESTIADVMITVAYIALLYFYFNFGSMAFITIVTFDILYVILEIVIGLSRMRSPLYVKTVKQSLLALGISSIIVNVTGLLLLEVSAIVHEIKEIYTVYPAVIDTVGDVGSIIGSITTTKLALGTAKPSLHSFRESLPEIGGIWASSAIMFMLFSLVASIIYHPTEPIAYLRFAALLLVVNILACTVIAIVALGTAIMIYKGGLEPDTFVIPIESSLADSVTTASILVVLIIVGFI